MEFRPTDDSMQHNGMNTGKLILWIKYKKAPTSQKLRNVACTTLSMREA